MFRFAPGFGLLLLALLLPGCASAPPKPAAQTVGQRLEGLLFWDQAQREARFARMHEIFPSTRVAHGRRVRVLAAGPPLQPAWSNGTTLDGYMADNHIAGVMVLQHGRVRLQRYAAGVGPHTRWTSFSVAKSVTSLLLGVALHNGEVRSLDDRLGAYIPALRGQPYGEVSVRQLLTMTSGIGWNEDYEDPHSDVAQMYRAPCAGDEAHIVSYMKALPRRWPGGTHWNYSTGETDLLGILVEHATGQSLAAYLSRHLWQPWGMTSDAYWLEDECSGANLGGSGLSATLADYARIGQFMLEGGRINGRPVVSPAWWQDATRVLQATDEDGRGYGYLWWIDADGSYAAIGIFGQLLYIDPARELVIAQMAAWPAAGSEALIAGRRAFVAAVKRALDSGCQVRQGAFVDGPGSAAGR